MPTHVAAVKSAEPMYGPIAAEYKLVPNKNIHNLVFAAWPLIMLKKCASAVAKNVITNMTAA